jgi:guanylate kinase
LIVVAGPSGVGKSSVVAGLTEYLPFHFSVSVTTRDPRPGEVDGRDRYFVDPEEFRSRINRGEFLEWAVYNGELYGTPRREVEQALERGSDVLLEIEVQGARQIKEAMEEAILIFIRPPSRAVLAERLRSRGDTTAVDVADRLEIATREMAVADELFDYQVVNDDLEAAVAEVVGILSPSKETPS